tara:strand:+ start:6320 stop:6595 length:276 start_codon:yes stop_codon:yes gene_type:complete
MVSNFTPIDFPDYADLTYKHVRPLLYYPGKAPPVVLAEVLRSTLTRKEKKLFDRMTSEELYNLIESYIALSMTREDLMNGNRDTDDRSNPE